MNKKFFIILFVILGLILFWFFNKKSDLKVGVHKNQIDFQFRPFSDQNITSNAIVANPKFKEITFNTQKSKKEFSFKDQLANVYRTVTSIKAPPTKNIEYGTWIWTPTSRITPDYTKSILNSTKENKINTIYLSIDSYLDIYVMKDGKEKDEKLDVFSKTLEGFIKQANSMDIAVDAEAGWRNWAEAGHTYKPLAIINFVKNFNERGEYDFRGIQYDIEPYLLEEFQRDEVPVLKRFTTLVDQTIGLLQDTELKFSVVIPDFYDEKDGMTQSFAYNEKTDYAFKHLVDILEKKAGSTIILMSYRNQALGTDGSIAISMNEMQTMDTGFYKTKLIIAQETGDVLPPYITFHNTSKKDIQREVSLIEDVFRPYPNFNGVAYHYANSFVALK